MTHDQVIADYLAALRAATFDLPAQERDELVGSIAEHIATAMSEVVRPSDADVRQILDRLGSPAAIAAEARGHSSAPVGSGVLLAAPPAAAPPVPRPGPLEWGGVAMLGIGSYLLPVIGTVAGLVMISVSSWWSIRQKVLAVILSASGAIVVPLLGLGLFAARAEPGDSGPSRPTVEVVPVQAPTPASESPR